MTFTPIAHYHNHPVGMPGEHPQGQHNSTYPQAVPGVAADTDRRAG